MNKNQYYNQHRNLDIHKAEMERKWRAYIREQEEMELARMHAIYEAQQQQSVVTSPGAGGGGGNGFGPLEDLGVPSSVSGVEIDGVFYLIVYNFEKDEAQVTELFDTATWTPPGMSSDLRWIQNGGWIIKAEKNGASTERLVFLDTSGNILDDITLLDQNESQGGVWYSYDYEVNGNNESFGHAYVYERYEGEGYLGQTVIWFNGKDKPVIHDFDNVNYTLTFFNENDYSDRKGNFTLRVRDENDGNTHYLYSLGKELALITSVNTNVYNWNMYSDNGSNETVVIIRTSSNVVKLIFVSSDQKVKTLEFPQDYYEDDIETYCYGTKFKYVVKLQQFPNSSLYDYFQYNENTGNVAKITLDESEGGYVEIYETPNLRYSDEFSSQSVFYIRQYLSSTSNSNDGRNGTQYTNFKLIYITSQDDKWYTFESPSFYMQWDPQNSDKGLYVLTDNNGSPDATMLYLSGGKETYTTLNPFAYQQGNYVYFTPFGVDSCFLYARNSYSNNLQPYVFKRGKLANGGDTPDLLNSYNLKFGMVLLEKPDFNGSSIYWWGEEVGQWTRIDSLNPSSYIDSISINSVVSPNPTSYATDVNMKYFGCNPSFAILREVDNSVSNARYHLFSSSDHNITGLRNPSVEGYSLDYEQMGSESYMYVYITGGNRNIKLYTAKDGLAVDYTTTGGNAFFNGAGMVGVRGWFDFFPETNYNPPFTSAFFDGDGIHIETTNSFSNYWFRANTKYLNQI